MATIYKIIPMELYREILSYVPTDVLKRHNWNVPLDQSKEESKSVPIEELPRKLSSQWKTYEDERRNRGL